MTQTDPYPQLVPANIAHASRSVCVCVWAGGRSVGVGKIYIVGEFDIA